MPQSVADLPRANTLTAKRRLELPHGHEGRPLDFGNGTPPAIDLGRQHKDGLPFFNERDGLWRHAYQCAENFMVGAAAVDDELCGLRTVKEARHDFLHPVQFDLPPIPAERQHAAKKVAQKESLKDLDV